MRTALVAAAVSAVVAATTATAATIVITSKNIKDGTIQTRDISAKAKRALKGKVGPRGPAGQAGQQGARGPSTALVGSHDDTVGQVPNTEANIGHVTLSPSANYVVIAKAAFNNPGSETLVECKLAPTGQPQSEWDRGTLRLATANVGFFDAGVITLVAHTIAPVGGFDFRCEDHGGTVRFSNQWTRAIQVETIQSSP
jgi:hypothetical protein